MNDDHRAIGDGPGIDARVDTATRRLTANMRGKACICRMRLGQAPDLTLAIQAQALDDMEPELCMELVSTAFELFLQSSILGATLRAEADRLVIAFAARAAPAPVPIDELVRAYFRHWPFDARGDLDSTGSPSGVLLAQLAWTLGRADVGTVRQRIAHLARFEGACAQLAASTLATEVTRLSEQDEPPLWPPLPPAFETFESGVARLHVGDPAAADRAGQAVECTVWYGTNRQAVDPDDGSKGYAKARGPKLEVGRCVVSVPSSRAFGSTGSSALLRWLKRTDDRIRLRETTPLAQQRQWQEMSDALTTTQSSIGRRDVLLYVHGYNTSFEQAAVRAAQLHVDLGVPGVTAFYSWPSRANLMGYFADEAAIDASETHLAEFVHSLCTRIDAGRVHVIAHSMGNRGLLRALAQLEGSERAKGLLRIGQIFLAAPDIDVELFSRLAAVYPKLSDRTTLYVSRRDRAVWLSLFLHQFPRVGYAPPVTVMDGIDTIEVSAIDFSQLGHGAYAQAEPLLYDIGGLLRNDLMPASRIRLRSIENEAGRQYWTLAR
ncbi:alpha/beta hydrolase [Variovorax sp. J22P271]|uniref:alpha/beta hydrolase n=1 Tax=Variovorax davisae TaxID=3053515 RepID=UPI0025762640|nr:alpha/beta hydrolase [Variovorax sp. J22P271]MDM0035584.1 alpha/beta hydrolase [Variovorax sp. J22P271]